MAPSELEPEPIPVTLLAGSFGAGKTTACNQLDLLADIQANVAVISHRFAEEYACQPLVVESSRCGLLEEVYDYGSGCLCCTPGGELNQRLNSMVMWGERYDHVLIRTGPAADPLIFADAVQRCRSYRLAGIVTVVDASSLSSDAALDQLRAADVLLVRGEEPAVHTLLSLKGVAAPVYRWRGPLCAEDLPKLLSSRPAGREYVCKPSILVPDFLASFHDTALRSVQIVESGAVPVDGSKRWIEQLMDQGFCIRLKAILPVAAADGRRFLLVSAVRGKPAEYCLVSEIPDQVYMGDLQVLVGMRNMDLNQPTCRVFILLGPPNAKGLGDASDLAAALPSSVDLSETFCDDVLGH